jgi:hypothetical protein
MANMLKKLIAMVSKRNNQIDKICSDWDKINEKIIQKSFDKR